MSYHYIIKVSIIRIIPLFISVNGLKKKTIFIGITLALQNHAEESMTFIVPILEMSLQKNNISLLLHLMLGVDLEENSDW